MEQVEGVAPRQARVQVKQGDFADDPAALQGKCSGGTDQASAADDGNFHVQESGVRRQWAGTTIRQYLVLSTEYLLQLRQFFHYALRNHLHQRLWLHWCR